MHVKGVGWENDFMKNKRTAFLIMILACSLIGCSSESKLYTKYKYPNEEFYGKELYSEIDNQSGEDELKVGHDVVSQADAVFHYLGKEAEADKTVGELVTYYYFSGYSDTRKVYANVKLITCKKVDSQYHVWAVYSIERYDKNDELVNGSSDILTLWICEKDKSGNVKVVDISEAP